MANNRIYLRCKGCGETLFLGKCFGDGYYWQDYGNGSLSEQLNMFYDKHTYCGKPKTEEYIPYDRELFPLREGFETCEGAYDIVYESDWGTGLPDPKDTREEKSKLIERYYEACLDGRIRKEPSDDCEGNTD